MSTLDFEPSIMANEIGESTHLHDCFEQADTLMNVPDDTIHDIGNKSTHEGHTIMSEQEIDDLSITMGTISIDGLSLRSFSVASMAEGSSDHEEKYDIVHESDFAKTFCIHDPENKSGGRTGSVAVKSLNDEFASDEQAFRLKNEYTISKHLIDCSVTRRALRQVEVHGVPSSIVFEWAMGIALGEWISSLHQKGRSPLPTVDGTSSLICERELKLILKIACEIAKAVSCLHDTGVAHKNLNPDHVIICDNSSDETISVKLIGLGYASLLKNTNNDSLEKQKDMKSLGFILFEMITGCCPLKRRYKEDLASENESGENGDILLPQNQLISLLTAKVPLVLAKWTLNLVGLGGESFSTPCSQTAMDAGRELYTMRIGLESIISNSEEETFRGRLQLPQGKLYGRDTHVQELIGAYHAIGTQNASKVVLLSGGSGVGKSALVEHVKENILDKKNVHFISGKFDQFQQAEPLSAFHAALAEYSNSIVQGGPQDIHETRKAIIEAINTDLGILTDIFPCLCKILGQPSTARTKVGPMESQNRFKFIFQMFIRAIATPSRPIVLFLDDLQWADELSLQLISTSVMDTEIKYFLFIGSYRGNKLTTDHPLEVQIREFESKQVALKRINLSSLIKGDVNRLVSETIGAPKHMAKPFADLVYQKTSGNVLLVKQFLQSLWDEGLLCFSLESNAWLWDTKTIEAKEVLPDAVMLMTEKILQLPVGCQDAIKVVACLGSRCDESTLSLVIGKGRSLYGKQNTKKRQRDPLGERNNLSALNVALSEGLLKKKGSDYIFVHDQIQHAAYSLLPDNEQGHLHKQIGYLILEESPDDRINDLIFVIVDQLNRGREFIKEDDKKVELAKLNLRAGEKSMSLALFLKAASYLEAGVGMLRDDQWEKHYDTFLQLYSLYAEAEYCNGHFQEVGRIAGVVITKAKIFEDKLRIYATLIKALGADSKQEEAIQLSFNVLSQLGSECQSPLPDKSTVMEDLMNTKKAFEDMTDDVFLNQEEMKDTRIISAMKFLHLLVFCAFFAKQEYLPVIITQMMTLTLRHGVCKETCVALASCSFLLGEKDVKGSEYIGHLAIILAEKLKASEYYSQVCCLVYSIQGWTKHIKLSLEPLMHGYQTGMQTGNIEYAMMSLASYLCHSFICSQNLAVLEKNVTMFGKRTTEYKQKAAEQYALPLKEAVTHLRCSTYDRSLLARREEYLSLYFEIIVAYIFCDYELAVDMVQRRQELEARMSKASSYFGTKEFFDGLIFLAMARKSKSFKWNFKAANAITKLEHFVQLGKANCEHKLLLLQAETESITGNKKDALARFDLAIATAEDAGFIHEQAIANERAADFLLRHDDSMASKYYGKAHNLYLEWGAQGKANHLCQNIPF